MIGIESASGRSSIFIGERLSNLPNHLPSGRVIIITDDFAFKTGPFMSPAMVSGTYPADGIGG